MRLTLTLVAAAASLGSVHTLAPDHWVPFAALARSEKWPASRTALVTALCGLGHVTVSVALGLLSAFFGFELLETFGKRLESVAGLLLIAFGVVYGAWGLHRGLSGGWHHHGSASGEPHWHSHDRGRPHVHQHPREGRLTPWALFLLFSADPCVAVIPLVFAAAPLGWMTTLAVAGAYEVATIATMVALVLPARAAAAVVRMTWVDRYGDACAGGIIAAVGLVAMRFGL